MNKRVYRYFFDFFQGQEDWLNNMAQKGYRLKACGRIVYLFENCNPNEYEYAVEFVGTQSYEKVKQYREYLTNMGFRTLAKNSNLNFSFGKVKWRPYAKGMGQVSTSFGGYNKELIILEKKKDGKPFDLHTNVKDKLSVLREVQRSYFWMVLVIIGLMAITGISNLNRLVEIKWILRGLLTIVGVAFLIPIIRYRQLFKQLKEESKTYE